MEGETPLSDITVIDCATLFGGPYVATLLGDFGADVIKIEHPDGGDETRSHSEDDDRLYWKTMGRNKKSVPVDLKSPEGQEIIRELVADADVFVENFRTGTLEDWNLGWDTLSDVNPDLVMVRVTGFGQTGPYKDRPGFGTLAESMSGFAYKNGWPDKPPALPQFGLADTISALTSTYAVMMALYWRDANDGTGQYIDASIMEPIFVTLMQPDILEYDHKGVVRKRRGNTAPYSAPRNTYKTKDGRWVALSASADNIARRVLRIVGGEELENDPRFQTRRDRVEHAEELDELIGAWMEEHTREEVLEIFQEAEAAIAPVYNIEDIFEDDYFHERDALISVEDDEYGELTLPGVIPKLSETPGRVEETGPALGEHAVEVLRDRTSLDEDEIRDLAEDGVLNIGE